MFLPGVILPKIETKQENVKIEAVPEEIHVIITRGEYSVPFCDAQVYGAIPSVIEVSHCWFSAKTFSSSLSTAFFKVRITTSKLWKFSKYVTFNMITNGGHLR